ncbi:PAS domain-containing protein [bacterium]|nr:PAS domain-containing protein [bacterium]
MKNKEIKQNKIDELRKKAEEKLTRLDEEHTDLSPEAVKQVLHELRVHQIELEMQNEELIRIQDELEKSQAMYFSLYDLAPVGYLQLSEKGLIIEANLTFATQLGLLRGELINQTFTRFIFPDDQDTFYNHRKKLFEMQSPQECELRLLCFDGTQFWAKMDANLAKTETEEPVCRVTVTDISEAKRLEAELHKAIEQVKTLRGIVPICSSCKKIRNDKGFWEMLEVYINEHTEAQFSHGVCPDCMKKLYPDYLDDDSSAS